MAPRNQIYMSPRRREIEAMLAARAPLKVIAERTGVSIFAASRHRSWMRRNDHHYFAALKRHLAERGIKRRSFKIMGPAQ